MVGVQHSLEDTVLAADNFDVQMPGHCRSPFSPDEKETADDN